MKNPEPTLEELWWAQQIQQAYVAQMRAGPGRGGFTLNGSGYEPAHKWVAPARAAIKRNIEPAQFVNVVFGIKDYPVPWEFVKNSGRMNDERFRPIEESQTVEEEVKNAMKWAMRQFLCFGPIGSLDYISNLVDMPNAYGVPAWSRVLIGYKYPEVLRAWLPDALSYFAERPDMVRVCKDMGFPPYILTVDE